MQGEKVTLAYNHCSFMSWEMIKGTNLFLKGFKKIILCLFGFYSNTTCWPLLSVLILNFFFAEASWFIFLPLCPVWMTWWWELHCSCVGGLMGVWRSWVKCMCIYRGALCSWNQASPTSWVLSPSAALAPLWHRWVTSTRMVSMVNVHHRECVEERPKILQN